MISADPDAYSIQAGLALRRSSEEQIRQVQLQLLQNHLEQAAAAPYYHDLFSNLQLFPQDIGSLDDLRKLPLTGRDALENHENSFIPKGVNISDLSHTSGTTGEPVIVAYSEKDLQRLAYNEAMAFYSAGVRADDIVMLTVTLDRCFIAGLAYYSGARFAGASVIRSGPGKPAQQWRLINQLAPTVLLGVPSFLLSLARWGKEQGYEPSTSSIRSIVAIGEPVRNGELEPTILGQLLQQEWQVPIFSSYGATEVQTAFGECREGCGGHAHPELMLFEIVDENGEVVDDGVSGEVVVTPLGVEGFPLLRFKTGDIARKHTSPCACGWNTERLGPIEGRISQRLKFKGTTLYPDMIFQALQEIKGTEDSCVVVEENFDLADEITIIIGCEEGVINREELNNILQSRLRVIPDVDIRPRKEVVDMTGKGRLRKPIRFFDRRRTSRQTTQN